MKWILFYMTFILLVFTISLEASARGPAVQPVTGISIDEYKEVDPKQDPGFNWGQEESIKKNSQKEDLASLKGRTISSIASPKKETTATWPLYIIGAIIITLPLILWHTTMSVLDDPETEESLPGLSDTHDLKSERQKREAHYKDDDDHFPKAS